MREPSHSLAGRFVEQARIARLLFPVPGGDDGHGLTPRQAQALLAAYAADGATTATELGVALGVDRTTLHSAIDDLVSRGWVKRITDPTDRRRRQIVLLEEGRAAAVEYVDEARERIKEQGVSLDRADLPGLGA